MANFLACRRRESINEEKKEANRSNNAIRKDAAQLEGELRLQNAVNTRRVANLHFIAISSSSSPFISPKDILLPAILLCILAICPVCNQQRSPFSFHESPGIIYRLKDLRTCRLAANCSYVAVYVFHLAPRATSQNANVIYLSDNIFLISSGECLELSWMVLAKTFARGRHRVRSHPVEEQRPRRVIGQSIPSIYSVARII